MPTLTNAGSSFAVSPDQACPLHATLHADMLLRFARSGGSKQQAEAARILAGQGVGLLAPTSSVLVDRILRVVGWGLISSNAARWLAEGGVLDGLDLGELKVLSKIGTAGQYAGNACT